MNNFLRYALVFSFIFGLNLGHGQITRYWSQDFSARATLMSGVVVAGEAGLAAGFYNPALISKVKKKAIGLNSSLSSFYYINLKNAIGEGLNVDQTRFDLVPRFIAIAFRPKWSNTFSFSILGFTNGYERYSLLETTRQEIDVIKSLVGNEIYVGRFFLEKINIDQYFGIGGAQEFGENFSIGASLFGTFKEYVNNRNLSAHAFPLNDSAVTVVGNNVVGSPVASYMEGDRWEQLSYNMVFKIGLAYRLNGFSFGLNLTMPSINLGGRAEYERIYSQSSLSSNMPELRDYIIYDHQEKMKAMYKMPFSAALGVLYKFNKDKTLFSVAVEYFSYLPAYQLFESQVNPSITFKEIFDTLSNPNYLNLVIGGQPILNYGFAFKHKLSDNFTIRGGAKSDLDFVKNFDFSTAPNQNPLKDLNFGAYHISLGLEAMVSDTYVIFGCQFTQGRSANQRQFANFSNPVEYNSNLNKPLQGDPENIMMVNYINLNFYLGFAYEI